MASRAAHRSLPTWLRDNSGSAGLGGKRNRQPFSLSRAMPIAMRWASPTICFRMSRLLDSRPHNWPSAIRRPTRKTAGIRPRDSGESISLVTLCAYSRPSAALLYRIRRNMGPICSIPLAALPVMFPCSRLGRTPIRLWTENPYRPFPIFCCMMWARATGCSKRLPPQTRFVPLHCGGYAFAGRCSMTAGHFIPLTPSNNMGTRHKAQRAASTASLLVMSRRCWRSSTACRTTG